MKDESDIHSVSSSKFETESEFPTERVTFEAPGKQGHSKPFGLTKVKSNASVVLPAAYKTVSHTIDDRLSQTDRLVVNDDKQAIMDLTWHVDDIDTIAQEFGTNMKLGLSESQVQDGYKKWGKNVQTKPRPNFARRLFFYFFNGFGALLLTAGILVIICYKPLGDPPLVSNLVLGCLLLAVFFLSAILNFVQDYSSSQILNSITQLLANEVKCLRDGSITVVDSTELVPGDIVIVEKDSKVPADLKLFELSGLVFDKCILTGESKPCRGKLVSSNLNYLENESIAMQGTSCIGGRGKGLVLSTGDDTIFGKISKLSSTQKESLTSLQKELFRFISFVAIAILTIDVIIIILWAAWLRHSYPDWINVPTLVIDVVSSTVAFIPEGLPVSLAVCLMVTAKKMRQDGIICKSLNIIETIGCINILCCDKTGTLTTGKMQVSRVHGDEDKVKLVGGLCNESSVNEAGEVANGNQTDQSIMQYIHSEGPVDFDDYELVQELGFNSKNKYMIKIFKCSKGHFLTVKGAPDILMSKAKFVMGPKGEPIPFTDALKKELTDIQMQWSSEGERIVLVGSTFLENYYVPEDDELEIKIEDFDFSIDGLFAISDPLRHDTVAVVNSLKAAHIRLVMITGDFELTAKSIAAKCGILSENSVVDTIDTIGRGSEAIIVSGGEFARLSEIEWDQINQYQEVVFARTTPEQKLKVMKELQSRKNTVGMIGDGVNDSPSLKQADVGIAMSNANEIAKEAADLVLLRDLSSLVYGVKYGRLVFENLRKIIFYLLPAGTYSELWAVLLNVIFGFPQMLSNFNMIIISIITDCIASLTISFEKEEFDIMEKYPRTVTGRHLVDMKLLGHSYFALGNYDCFTSMFLAFLNMKRHGISFSETHRYNLTPAVQAQVNRSSSIYFVNLIVLQAFNLICVRTRIVSAFRNFSWRLLVIPPIFASTFIWNYIPALQKALDSDTVPVEYYFISLGFGIVLFFIEETRKYFIRRYPHGLLAKIAW